MAFQAFSLARVRGPLASAAALALLGACSTQTAVPMAAPAPDGSAPIGSEAPASEVASGYRSGMATVYAEKHMAAAANPLATEAGRRILRQGGSAIDAAVAMQAVLTLVEPQASGIGGGAFLLYWDGKRVRAYDGRETAPAGVDANLFLRPDGTPMGFSEARIGGRSVGAPGVLRVLELAHRQHGKLPWARLFQPAIELAEQGFPISPRLFTQIAADPFVAGAPELAALYLTPDGKPKPVGTIVKNPQLAQTLREIARHGPGAFYTGPIAADIVKRVNGAGNPGALSLADLRGYRAKARDPLCTDYKRWKVCGMPPPSSGGIAIAQMLGTLQALEARDPKYALAAMAPRQTTRAAGFEPTIDAVHVVSEAGRQADADRGLYVADADFVPVNVKGLTDPGYLALRAGLIGDRSTGRADPGTPPGTSIALAPDRSPPRVSTSQIVAVDNAGGAVSMTTAIAGDFGSHLMVRGFVLNSGLIDFSFAPNENGKPVANRVQAGKRPRSPMAPTLVFERDSGRLVAALGSPGGSQITEYVSKTLIGLLDWDMDVQNAIDLPNFGSRNGPTEVERGLVTQTLVQGLKARGHDVAQTEMTSGTQAIVRRPRDDGKPVWAGGADPRREGVVLGD
ncbi:gamma-glutamyltransferase family protein [Ralstonia solanacearum]|nr:gamma-glutamyltransferase family protein [Ralstonia solanacearum]AMP69220.1 gamma-glutamyltransferase [Ralstonia solanacearum]AMP73869.1 gamma-glutamyltransferase [Ralstonia solanacearum]EUJ15984.1 gamma-glutamyltransferase [Ralstonia solanacearum P673]MBB6586375.1 gamma-glutamyltransferase family protein [Ralstonia solanacearum]MCG3575809.1 gamma-glutamyltransferase family protein [Ralstonia solanacearum]